MSIAYHTAIGGTFDHFHAGHKHFLLSAFNNTQKVTIGMADGSLLEKKEYPQQMQSYSERERFLRVFLAQHAHKDVHILRLTDPFGPTITDVTIDRLVVTPNTIVAVPLLQEERKKNGLVPLHIDACALLLAWDGSPLSSSRVRSGEVDRAGRCWWPTPGENITLTSDQKKALQTFSFPLVDLEMMQKNTPLTILVGDVVTRTWIDAGLLFNHAFIDGHSQRHTYQFRDEISHLATPLPWSHPAGTIQWQSWLFLRQLLAGTSSQSLWRVEGEEDLLTVAAVWAAPLGSRVVFGQPNQGMSQITVTEETKEQFRTVFCA